MTPSSSDYPTNNRTLAAIVFTDGVGFSALMSQHEEQTLRLIKRDLAMMSQCCRKFGGQVIKSTGDGLLLYFTSAIQAVACAIEIQKHLANQAKQLPPEEFLNHRIGIHLGDVFFSENDVMGNGVNIAARLQSIAEPGGICISQTVYDVIKNTIAIKANYLGPQKLKNIQESIPIYQILVASQSAREQYTKATEIPIAPAPQNLKLNSRIHQQVLLNKVKNFWIKGVLDNSLREQVRINLGLQSRRDAIQTPWNLAWESLNHARQSLPPGTRIIEQFDQLGAGRTLLILGEPGAGKTTLLLELTQVLINRAEKNQNLAIPVVLNLSSWSEKFSLVDWIITELKTKYQVAQKISKNWLNTNQLILMLDGLDEVSVYQRNACVKAINTFNQDYGQTEMVVCSRIQDYEALTDRLKFQGAVSISPLTDQQIQSYLMNGGTNLAGVAKILAQDQTLQDLARSPLILNIIILSYQGIPVEHFPEASVISYHQSLFQVYIERMFTRRLAQSPYSQKQSVKWLRWLALKMLLSSESIFLIEELQPLVLSQKRYQILYRIGVKLAVVLIYGAILGTVYGLILGLIIVGLQDIAWLVPSLESWVVYGLLGGIILGVIGVTFDSSIADQLEKIEPVENLTFSWRKASSSFAICLIVSVIGLLIGSVMRITLYKTGISWQPEFLLSMGMGIALCMSLRFGLIKSGIERKISPNQGIWRSLRYGGIFLGLMITAIILVYLLTKFYPIRYYGVGLGFGFSCGLFLLLRSQLCSAGVACIQHLILRLVLWIQGYTPWNYARFLDWATECILLQKVGGGYMFVHRLLLEYFALMESN